MEQTNNTKGYSTSLEYLKGMAISHVALITVLVKTGVITVEDVIKELDEYIHIFSEEIPEGALIADMIISVKGILLKVYSKDSISSVDRFTWVAGFAGQA